MTFWKETWEVMKQSTVDFYQPVLHPIKHWWLWILVFILTAILMYFDIKGPLWWLEYWLTGREIY